MKANKFLFGALATFLLVCLFFFLFFGIARAQARKTIHPGLVAGNSMDNLKALDADSSVLLNSGVIVKKISLLSQDGNLPEVSLLKLNPRLDDTLLLEANLTVPKMRLLNQISGEQSIESLRAQEIELSLQSLIV
jgi:hypothetical protein